MTYTASTSVTFPCPVHEVFETLTDLSMMMLWNSAMVRVSHDGQMKIGLVYETETIVAGRSSVSRIEVVRIVQNKEVELVSHSGLIGFQAFYWFLDKGPRITELVCELKFTLRNFVLDLAPPIIESMTEARLRGDMETLRALICDHTKP